MNFLSKRWFLVLLLLGVGLAACRPDWLRPWTTRWEPRSVVAGALFLIALSLESRHFLQAIVRPWPALWAVVMSYGALPLLALLAGPFLEPDYRVGLFVVASVPCTLASAALWTRMAGGNEATALLVILLTTATSWLVTTAWLVLGTGLLIAGDSLGLMGNLVLILVIPVGLGQAVQAIAPVARFATRCRKALGVVSQLLVLLIILKACVEVRDRLEDRFTDLGLVPLVTAALWCIGAHLATLLGGIWSGRRLGFDRPSQIAIAFAGSQKTLPVALVLFEAYFKDAYPLAVLPIVFYHVGQLIVDTFIAHELVNGSSPERGLPAEADI